MKLKDLKNKKILILGFGKEGRDTLVFLRKTIPLNKIGIADKENILNSKNKSSLLKGAKTYFGENYLNAIKDYDVVIKSPGVQLNDAKKQLLNNKKITSQTDIFLNNCKGTVIGITGTKGKSTTSSLIYELLKTRKHKVFLIGNIGKPALNYLLKDNEKTFFVYELSSFQLENITKSPHIALILNVFKDHLDYHKTMSKYIKAKSKITEFQNKEDYLIYNHKDEAVKKIASKSKAQKILFNPEKGALEPLMKVAELLKISSTDARRVLKNFAPLSHRLENLGEKNGIIFYNDSASTVPEATIFAIDKLGNKIDSLIVGGVGKGGDFSLLSKKISESNIRNVILFPETGYKMEKLIIGENKKIFWANNMKEAVEICKENTKKNKICLLSPAGASYNMFKNYKQRGQLFKHYALK